jgi:hypothetical protein
VCFCSLVDKTAVGVMTLRQNVAAPNGKSINIVFGEKRKKGRIKTWIGVYD